MRGAVILTGEDAFDLGTSSHYRIIEVLVEEGTFDGKILREFQADSTIMAKYFALYVKFLTQNHLKVCNDIKRNFINYRRDFEEKFSIPRFAETATLLRIQIEILSDFAQFCNEDLNLIEWYKTKLLQNVIEVVKKNQNAGIILKPTLRFLQALWQSINEKNCKIADNEEIYVQAEEKFIGFHESSTNLLWLRPNDVYQAVKKFYENRSERFLTTFDTIKRALFQEGLSEGANKNGNKEFLKRAKKGSRKRMLVINVKKIEKTLEKLKGDF